MTAPVRGTPRLSAIPASQNTAPVAEFRCLFTHDTRKKQKKWQDGYLKFHSFNSRVIVYNASRFTVGDTYYKDSNELREGDELMLDKGVMVEVAEPMGVTQTDLTPLFERKTKVSPQGNNATGPQKPLSRPTIPASNPLRAAPQLRHKSLNTLLGTHKGPIGKAVPIRSPYEERMEKENQHGEERATKRQKTAHGVPVQQVARPSLASETAPKSSTAILARPLRNDSDVIPPPQTLPRGATVISLSSQPEAENIPSDVTLPCTPSKPKELVRPALATSVTARKEPLPQQSHVHTTPKLPKGKVPVPQVKVQHTPRPPPQPSSPPVSASNHIVNVDFAIQPLSDPPREPSPVRSSPKPPQPLNPLQNRKTKSLKLSTGTRRGMLLCQSAPIRRQPSPGEPNTRTSKPREHAKNVPLQNDGTNAAPRNDSTALQSATAKGSSTTVDARRPIARPGHGDMSATGTEQAPLEILDNPELVHGFMDQQLLVTSSPPSLLEPAKPKSPIAKPTTAKHASTKKSPKSSKRVNEPSAEGAAPKKKKVKATQTKDAAMKPAKKKKAEKAVVVPSRSPSPGPISNIVEAPSRNNSVAPSESATERPRSTSISVSSTKLPATSTGGFKKRPKKAQTRTAASEVTVLPPRPTAVALPPHPLRSSKNGPLMSTTELSALLQKGPKSMRLEDDPIEDASQGDNVSPSRRSSGFKRSRSENNAPIPSTSEEWEQRNLPKHPNPSDPGMSAATVAQKAKVGGLAALIKKTDPRRKFRRAQSLNVETGLANANAEEPEVVTPPVDDDVGPWSTEAFDLFDWRPPGKEWRAEGTKMRLVDVDQDEDQGIGLLVDER